MWLFLLLLLLFSRYGVLFTVNGRPAHFNPALIIPL